MDRVEELVHLEDTRKRSATPGPLCDWFPCAGEGSCVARGLVVEALIGACLPSGASSCNMNIARFSLREAGNKKKRGAACTQCAQTLFARGFTTLSNDGLTFLRYLYGTLQPLGDNGQVYDRLQNAKLLFFLLCLSKARFVYFSPVRVADAMVEPPGTLEWVSLRTWKIEGPHARTLDRDTYRTES